MSGDRTEVCALCKQVRELKKSHIIPEFLYAPLYEDSIHEFNTYGHKGKPKTGILQKGEREYLLCGACEQHFCDYETWVADFYKGAVATFYDTTRSEVPFGKKLRFTRIGPDGNPTISPVPIKLIVDGFEYEKMKLFLLSVLRRMGVSRLHFFRGVTLGFQEKRLRKMLLDNDPGEAERFACQLRLIELNGQLITDCQIQPQQFDFRGKKCCWLYSTGFRFDFMVSNHAPPEPELVERYCVKPRSQYVVWVESIRTHPQLEEALLRFAVDMKRAGVKDFL